MDPDLFPLLTLRSCISEAAESKNGPRFCAQDNFTGCAYEVRCVELPLVGTTGSLAEADRAKLRRQQQRIDALMAASSSGACPPSVALPVDVYIQELPATGATYVASVDAFAGLSLADVMHSGWGLIEENVFFEVLGAVEQYGCAAASLPPHGNLCPDAIKQVLTVREGAAEAEQRSRWVVSDWLLLHDEANEGFHAESCLSDVEWLLHLVFSQLNVASAQDGAFLSHADVNTCIGETVDRIRDSLLRMPPAGTPRRGDGSAIAAFSTSPPPSPSQGCGQPVIDVGSADVTPTRPTAATATAAPSPALNGAGSPTGGPVHSSTMRDATLRSRIAFHQAELRREKQLANKYRRRNAPLPPLPSPPPQLGNKQDYEAAESARYEMHYLTSPIRARPSRLLTEPASGGQDQDQDQQQQQRAQSAPRATARGALRRGGSPGSPRPVEYYQPRQQLVNEGLAAAANRRETLLGSVIRLALATRRAQEQAAERARQEDHTRRRAQQEFLACSARVEAARQRRAASVGAQPRGPRAIPSPFAFNKQQHQRQQAQVPQPPGANRRRFTPQEQPLSARLQRQQSVLGGALGASTLIQVSSSVPFERAPSLTQSPARPTASPLLAGVTFSRGPSTHAPPPFIEPLPLAALLASREKENLQIQRQKPDSRPVPAQYSVRGSPRAVIPPTTLLTQPPATAGRSGGLAAKPRGTYPGAAGTAGVLATPRRTAPRGCGLSPTARASPGPSSPSKRSAVPRKTASLPTPSTPQATPRSRRPSVSCGPGLSTSGAHPHALSSPNKSQRPSGTVKSTAGDGSPVATPRRTEPADGAAAKPRPLAAGAGVRMKSPRIAVQPLSARVRPVKVTAEVRGHAISPRSPRFHHAPPQAGRVIHADPFGGCATPRDSLKAKGPPPKAAGRKTPAPKPSTRTHSNTAMKRTASSSDNVRKRDVHPVHEASIGIFQRRRAGGAHDLW